MECHFFFLLLGDLKALNLFECDWFSIIFIYEGFKIDGVSSLPNYLYCSSPEVSCCNGKLTFEH